MNPERSMNRVTIRAWLLLALLPVTAMAQGRVTRRGSTPPAAPAAQPQAPQTASYRVRVDPSGDVFVVRAEFTFASPRDTLLVSLPAWTTGSYGINNYARWVHGVRAEADGQPAAWDKLDKDTWRIATRGARRVAIEFSTNPDSLMLNYSMITPDFAVLNNSNLLVHPEGSLDFPGELTVEVPQGWRLASGLTSSGPNSFRMNSYHDLIDDPIFAGRFWHDSLQVDGRYIRFAMYPDSAMTPPVWDSLRHAITGIVTQQNRIFGGPPYDAYTVLFLAPFDPTMEWGGGLEHSNSQLNAIAAPFFANLATGELGGFTRPLLSHEFMHLFNVKRIRPAEMWPYDYAREQYTPLLWWSEGVTDYYSDVALARAGLFTLDRFIESVQSNINQVEDAAEIVAVEDASINTWIDPVYVNEGQYYYPKGSLLGLMLDINVRNATRNQHSLDEVIRRLYTDHWRRGRGFTTADLLGYIRAWWPGVDEFYTRYINGREPLPYAEVLPLGGIAANVMEVRIPFFDVALDTVVEQGGARVLQVTPNSAASRAGLLPGDILLRVGDVSLGTNPRNFGVQYRARYREADGQSVAIAIRRNGQDMNLQTTIASRAVKTVRVTRDASASGLPVEIRAGITGQR